MATRRGRNSSGAIVDETVPQEDLNHNSAKRTEHARRRARARIDAHVLATIAAAYPGNTIENDADLEALKVIFQSILPSARHERLVLAADIYAYGRNQKIATRTWTAAVADAYDPAADENWPS